MSMLADLLARARESLDDARLLAEHRRRNESVLTRLALHQALQAVSQAEGLDADDGLRLDTLFRRVAPDHPQAALIAALQPDEAQTIAAVAALVAALGQPVARSPEPTPRPPGLRPVRGQRAEAAPEPAEPRAGPEAPRRSPAESSGPTALDASPEGHGRPDAASSFPSAAFWTLMDRWEIGDLDALALIGHEGGLTKKGTRPRFRLQGEEATRYASLRALDTALEGLELLPKTWLATPQTDAPLSGETPLSLLLRDPHGATQLVRILNRQGLKAALQRG